MSTPRKYSTAKAFRVALETRLKQIADSEQIDLQRLRRLIAFDRLLSRICQSKENRWVLKDGYAMELRMKEARTTKDIDLVNVNISIEKAHILLKDFIESLKDE